MMPLWDDPKQPLRRAASLFAVGAFLIGLYSSASAAEKPMAEVVVAIRYLQPEGVSHAHLYLYREDGRLLRQLTRMDAGQDRAPIFARVSGYLKSWSADIGARVKAGQVIAEIEAPDLDQQLLQARADLASQQASARLSEATLNRRKTLVASNFVSAQEIDERTADLSNKNAAVHSGQANVERLEALAGYKKITVPFDGVVTARDTDVGALINAGGGSGPAMFVVSDITKLRVYVNVPQNYVPAIKIGAKATMVMPEYPNRTFQATVEASSQAVDVASGTTRMQLRLDAGTAARQASRTARMSHPRRSSARSQRAGSAAASGRKRQHATDHLPHRPR